jgi:fructoselysine-6-P-deglycase FrlB-like protein
MNHNSHEILTELMEQPQRLKDLITFYASGSGSELLSRIPCGGRVLFTGAGSEYYLSEIAAELCCEKGVDARAVEATNLVQWPDVVKDQYSLVFILSSLGSEEEIARLQSHLDPRKVVVVTNKPESSLAEWATINLPIFAGLENWQGSKSFLNAGILLWLVSRRITQAWDGSENDQLKRLRQRVQLLLEGRAAIDEQWRNCLADCDHLFFDGCKINRFIAAQSSLTFLRWRGIQVSAFPRDTLAGSTKPGWGIIEFRESPLKNNPAAEIPGVFDKTIFLVDGFPQPATAPLRPGTGLAAEMGMWLNWVSIQLLAIHPELH